MDGADVTRVDASISPSVFLATLQTWRSYVVETDCYHARTEPPQKKSALGPIGCRIFELTISSTVSTVCRQSGGTWKKVSTINLSGRQTNLDEASGEPGGAGTERHAGTDCWNDGGYALNRRFFPSDEEWFWACITAAGCAPTLKTMSSRSTAIKPDGKTCEHKPLKWMHDPTLGIFVFVQRGLSPLNNAL